MSRVPPMTREAAERIRHWRRVSTTGRTQQQHLRVRLARVRRAQQETARFGAAFQQARQREQRQQAERKHGFRQRLRFWRRSG